MAKFNFKVFFIKLSHLGKHKVAAWAYICFNLSFKVFRVESCLSLGCLYKMRDNTDPQKFWEELWDFTPVPITTQAFLSWCAHLGRCTHIIPLRRVMNTLYDFPSLFQKLTSWHFALTQITPASFQEDIHSFAAMGEKAGSSQRELDAPCPPPAHVLSWMEHRRGPVGMRATCLKVRQAEIESWNVGSSVLASLEGVRGLMELTRQRWKFRGEWMHEEWTERMDARRGSDVVPGAPSWCSWHHWTWDSQPFSVFRPPTSDKTAHWELPAQSIPAKGLDLTYPSLHRREKGNYFLSPV